MQYEKLFQLINSTLIANYSTTPIKFQGSSVLYDPSTPTQAKQVTEVADFIEVTTVTTSTERKIMTKRRIDGFIRFNIYDQRNQGDTAFNAIRTSQIQGILDAALCEQTFSDANVNPLTFLTSSGLSHVGINEDYQRYESFFTIGFYAEFA